MQMQPLSRFKDGIRTHQKNGWIRTNVYWDDGTAEELFEKED